MYVLRFRLALIVVCLGLQVLPSRVGLAAVFDPHTFTLDNGMRVIVVSNHRAPVVTHMVWYKVGAADEPPGKSGMAHLLEHLMFKGTKNYPSGEFSKIVSRIGGQENAFTGHDFTAYYQTVAKDQLSQMMKMEADRMVNLALTTSQVTSEQKVVLEERRQRIDNKPSAILDEGAKAALFMNSNYGRPVIGWTQEIMNLTLDDVLGFYRSWYVPNNAILVIAGDVTADEVRPLAEKTYGRIPAELPPTRVNLQEPSSPVELRASLRDGRVNQPAWRRTYLAPSYLSAGHEHAHALQVLAAVFGGGATSRLYQTLVVDEAKAVSAAAWYDPNRRGLSTFDLYLSPRPQVGVDELEGLADQLIAQLIAGEISQDEVERAKTQLRAQAVFARDGLRTGARALGEAVSLGLGIDQVELWPEAIAKVTRDDVVAAARLVFGDERSVTSRLLPKQQSAEEQTDHAALSPGQVYK